MTALARRDLAALDHPSGYLALTDRNALFTVPGLPGFLSYRTQGKHRVAFGGVHAPRGARAALLDAFIAEASAHGLRVLAVQVREEQGELFESRGFTVNKFGSTYGVRLAGYSFAGTRKVNLRNKVKRAKALGLTVAEVGRELPSDEETFRRLNGVSEQWLAEKKKKELDFMIGELGGPRHPDRRVFAVIDPGGGTDPGGDRRSPKPAKPGRVCGADQKYGGRMVAFITYVPAYGARPGWLHDLTRRVADAPVGCMELCNQFAMERLGREGAQWLHFGFTPFLVDGDERPGASRVMAWVLRALGRWGAAIYPAQRQREYKKKWLPDVVEAELVACRPLSVRAVIDLLLLTRSV